LTTFAASSASWSTQSIPFLAQSLQRALDGQI
jgi:hypothetical protein